MAELRHFSTVQNGPKNNALIEFSDQVNGVIQVRVTVNMELTVATACLWGGFMDEVKSLLHYGQSPKVNA